MIDLRHGDCLELMRDIPDGSVDMILADPPYGTTRNRWDSVIPLDKMWEQFRRIAKEDAAICLFSQQPFTTELINSNIKQFRYEWVWEKTKAGGFLNARRRPMQAHEIITVFSQVAPVYYPQMEPGEPYTKTAVTDGDGGNYGRFSRVGVTAVNEGTRFPRTVIKFANANNASEHPTQKPVPLLEYLIKTYTRRGGVVLDPCMGSGSTGVACVNTGREFIGMELDAGYFAIAEKRVKEAVTDG